MDKKIIKKELRSSEAIEICANQFGLLGDPTRMKICWLLCKHPELSVGEIADFLGVSISVVSHSLRQLREHNLVKTRREYKQVFYRLSEASFNRVIKKGLAGM